MVQASDIRDIKSLQAWLEGRTREDSVWIAQRAALRVAPIVWVRPLPAERGIDLTALAMCRCLLTAGVAGKMPTPEVRAAAARAAAFADADAATNTAVFTAATAFADAAAAAARATTAAFAAAARATTAAFADADAATATAFAATAATRRDHVWRESREDALVLERGEELFAARLWSLREPDWFLGAEDEFRKIWPGDPAFSFWLRWWDGVLSGQQLPWDLQEKVALIPDNIWRQGAEAVATEIARIEEQQRLQREVERLRSELAGARSQIAAFSARGHNNPPELVEPVAEVERQADVLAAALGEAEQELAKEAPRAAVLQRIGRELFTAASKSLAYCASLGDAALKKAAEEVGSTGAKALIGAGLIAWVSQLGAVQVLARALEAFAKMLGGS